MTDYIKKFEFKKSPKEITYIDGEPLKLTENFVFFHSKNKIRKSLTPLQNLVKSHTKNPLLASGIRDTYLKKEFSEKYLIVLFTTQENGRDTNSVIEKYTEIELNQGCYYLVSTSAYMLLLAKDMEGLNLGVSIMEEILSQTLEDYFSKKNYDEYIKIHPFKAISC